jgi:diguanylate cyclase (GGDEF)-like protein/PAS domain S-box-containing protein
MGTANMKVLLIDEDKECRLAFERGMNACGFACDCSAAASLGKAADPLQFDVVVYQYNPSARPPDLKPGARLIVTADGPAMEQAVREITFPVYAFLLRDPGRVFIATLPPAISAIYRSEKEAERSRELYGVVEQAADSLLITGPDGVIEHVNRGFEKLFGYTQQEAAGKTPRLLKSGKHNKNFYQAFWQQIIAGNVFRAVFINKSKTGELFYIEQTITPIKDKSGAIIRFIATGRDITATGRNEQALQEANEKLIVWLDELEQRDNEISLLSEMSNSLQVCYTEREAYAVIAKYAQKLFPNDAGALCVLNEKRDTVMTVSLWGMAVPSIKQAFSPSDCRALRSGVLHFADKNDDPELICGHVVGHVKDSSICAPMIAHGEPLGLLYLQGNPGELGQPEEAWKFQVKTKQGLAVTVAEHVALALANIQLRDKLRYQATRDPLTNLFNRRFLEESLALQINKARRNGRPIGVIMVDIDRFKLFNDNYGHAAGDAMLSALGKSLKASVRSSDIACRYGGEEFILILPDATAPEAAKRAEAVCGHVRNLNITYENKSLSVTISVGVAAFPEHGGSVDAVIRCADDALYEAKKTGRDKVVIFTPDKQA